MIILWSLVIIPVFLQVVSYIYLFYKYVIYGSRLGLEQTEKIVLLESSVDLLGLIKKAIEMQKIYLDQKIIKVVENYIDSSLYVYCDQVHMLGVINNIIKNAGEAITSDNGIIELGLYAYKKILLSKLKITGLE